MNPRIERRAASRPYALGASLAIVGLVGTVALGPRASAQRDEFDLPSPETGAPGTTRTPPGAPGSAPEAARSATPSPPAADIPLDAAAEAVVVHVRVLSAPEFGAARTGSECASRRRVTVSVRGGTGLLLPDGRTVAVARALVADGFGFVVHGADPAAPIAARRLARDESDGLAFLRLVSDTGTERAAAATFDAVASGHRLRAARRLSDGRLAITSAYAQFVQNGDDLVASFEALTDAEGRVVFRDGRPLGMIGEQLPGGTEWTRHVIPIGLLERAVAAIDVSALAASDASIGARLTRTLQASIPASDATSRTEPDCAVTTREPNDGEDADETDPTDEEGWSARELVLLAAVRWNDGQLPGEASTTNDERVGLLLERIRAIDPDAIARSSFARTVVAERLAERMRLEAEARRREDAEREARARAEARHRRLNLPLTYHAALTTGLARDGGNGFGSGGVSFGAFVSLPPLGRSGRFRAAAALGASGAIGHGDSLLGYAVVDVGVTARIGGERAGFALLAWSPGWLASALDGRADFLGSSFRAAAGIALDRRVLFFGYRSMTPRGDYAAHLLEVGVAFRHGPTRATPTGVAVADGTTTTRTRTIDRP